ncbi:BTAD domain-containing putative transcriptional regulator [Paenibacillus solisilvae]|uniref:BTAD domain-containing putative transcriptional regulator n=1 Tax=Paenibacillus solisilvae TaxID=2486751 RepID=A0ABW0W052_9BACL
MKQNNHLTTNQDKWLQEVLALEQAILDGHMPSAEQLLVVPSEIRMKSPLLLRAECENGLLDGQLMETQQLLKAALKGFAAQADEASMLAMMGMLSLLYEQVGDRQESQPLLALLGQEWNRTPEFCSGFVPWALARAAANGSPQGNDGTGRAEALFFQAAERFRQESKPIWTGFVLLDHMLFNPVPVQAQDWLLLTNWLKRHAGDQQYSDAVYDILTNPNPTIQTCDELPLRYAYLCKAIILDAGDELVPESLSGDIEVQMYAAASKIKRNLAEGAYAEAANGIELLERYHQLVVTPAARQALQVLKRDYNQLTGQSEKSNVTAKAAQKEKKRSGGTKAQTAAATVRWQVMLINGIRFEATNGKVAEPVWKRRKAGELFIYLLLQPGYKANREQVIERVFGEGEASKRSNQLYVTLHDLRQALKELGLSEDLVYAKRGVIGIEENSFDGIDAETFLTLSRVGDQLWTDDWEAACRLYEEAMPLYGQLGTELPYAEWLERIREQLLDRQTTMLKRLAMYHMERRDDARAEQRIAEWIALRPDQENAYETMIRHCLNLGRRAEAISWYRRLEKICREELGIEPLEEIRLLVWK